MSKIEEVKKILDNADIGEYPEEVWEELATQIDAVYKPKPDEKGLLTPEEQKEINLNVLCKYGLQYPETNYDEELSCKVIEEQNTARLKAQRDLTRAECRGRIEEIFEHTEAMFPELSTMYWQSKQWQAFRKEQSQDTRR